MIEPAAVGVALALEAVERCMRENARLREHPNMLPLEGLPPGWEFMSLTYEADEGWFAGLEWNGPSSDDRPDYRTAIGPTPRAAVFAAIEKITK